MAGGGLVAPAADFVFGATFTVVSDGANDLATSCRTRVCDRSRSFHPRLAARRSPAPAGGGSLSERRGHGWAVIARAIPDGSEAGGVAERLLPDIFKIWVTPDVSYSLTEHPLSEDWTLAHEHRLIARLTKLDWFTSGLVDTRGRRFDAGAIEISDGTITTAPLALPIMLALAMVKAQATIPGTSGQGY